MPSQIASSVKPQNEGNENPIGIITANIVCGVTLWVLGIIVIRLTAPRKLTRDVLHTMLCTLAATTLSFVSFAYLISVIFPLGSRLYLFLMIISAPAVLFMLGSVIVVMVQGCARNANNCQAQVAEGAVEMAGYRHAHEV